ncbi:MAG: hypothetical protein EBX49_08100 [Synechococcaceae bacterium WB8_1B_136]|nr:hypothetical protein [Synechococcaceae bacterium WB8_1B_136]
MSTRQHLLLSACGAGLSCAAILGGGVVQPPADAATATQKASPFAEAKDETSASVRQGLDDMAGTKAAGSSKSSPFAGAKESDADSHSHLQARRERLWWLLLPVGLAAVSYGALRAQEGDGEG